MAGRVYAEIVFIELPADVTDVPPLGLSAASTDASTLTPEDFASVSAIVGEINAAMMFATAHQRTGLVRLAQLHPDGGLRFSDLQPFARLMVLLSVDLTEASDARLLELWDEAHQAVTTVS